MTLNKKQIEEQFKYWEITAEHDWEIAQFLWHSKKYDACLFYCHLTIEKYLKGLVVLETGKIAPFIHDLEELARKSGIVPADSDLRKLGEFTYFNVACRYVDFKKSFWKLCNKTYSEPYFKEAKKIIIWLKKSYLEKK